MKYYEIAITSVRNRSIIVTPKELKDYHKQAIDNRQELYRSVYHYDKKILDHLNTRKSVKGYIGIYGLEKLIFDVDKKTNSDEYVLGQVRYFVQQLIDDWNLPKECIKVWYSGTGYHVTTPDFFGFMPSAKLPEIVKATLGKYFPELDLSAYDPLHIIRAANTINPKVRRFKIYITLDELSNLEVNDIIRFSEENRMRQPEKYDTDEVPVYKNKIIIPANVPKNKIEDNLTSKITCMQKLYNRGPIEGQRHHDILRMVSAWRRAGMPLDAIVEAIKAWAGSMDKYETEKLVKDTFNANSGQGYNFGCTDEIMMKHCDERCVYFKSKDLVPEVKSHEDMEKSFVNFIRSDFKTKSIDLMETLEIPNKTYRIIPGENILMFGNGGLGKTALAQNMAVRNKHLRVLYGNFEFTTQLLYRRFVQIEHNMTKDEVMAHYRSNENSLSHGLEHIRVVDNTIDIKGLYQMIESFEPGLIILDTLKKIRTPDRTEYGKDETLANLFKSLAKNYNCIVMAINHISKVEADKKKLDQHSGKGSNSLENMSDHVIILEGNENTDDRTIKAGKARDEGKYFLPFKYNWQYFKYNYVGK